MKLKYDALQELYDTLVSAGVSMSHYADSPVYKAFKECDEKLSESIAFDYLKKLQDRIEVLERTNKDLRDNNDKLGDKIIELKKKNEDLKKDLNAKTKENSTLVSANVDLSDRLAKLQRNFDRINHLWTIQIQENMELRSKITDLQETKPKLVDYEALRKELDDAKEDRDTWQNRAMFAEKELDLTKRNRDGWKSRAMHTEKRYAELRKENADLSEKVVDFEKRIAELQKKGDDLTKKGEDLQQEIEELKKSRKRHRQLHVGEGTRHLWGMLQNVRDVNLLEEFDPECETLGDILDMDLDDFLDAYKKWQKEKEQNETDRMRDWLADFCEGRVCKGCPLESNEYKCGCGYSFKKTNESDTRIIPDEDIKRYYEKTRGCGVVPNEEEHKLDYGDAVRVPWRDYDYMYIGPEGKHIRLFDPKTHTVVVVSVKDNLTYQGSKIILCNEDDIRKIWKDKK